MFKDLIQMAVWSWTSLSLLRMLHSGLMKAWSLDIDLQICSTTKSRFRQSKLLKWRQMTSNPIQEVKVNRLEALPKLSRKPSLKLATTLLGIKENK